MHWLLQLPGLPKAFVKLDPLLFSPWNLSGVEKEAREMEDIRHDKQTMSPFRYFIPIIRGLYVGFKAGFLSPYITMCPLQVPQLWGVPQNLTFPHGGEGASSFPLNLELATSMLIQLDRYVIVKLGNI